METEKVYFQYQTGLFIRGESLGRIHQDYPCAETEKEAVRNAAAWMREQRDYYQGLADSFRKRLDALPYCQ